MNSLRRAFGFSPDTEDEEGNYDPTVPTYAVDDRDEPSVSVTPVAPVAAPSSAETDEPVAAVEEKTVETDGTATLTDDLFDAVIELFNRTQPEFVRQCLNLEAQRKYILNSLSTTLRQRIDAALSAENGQWKTEKEALEKEIADLETVKVENESLRKENRAQRLSAESKRRAMLDRINDLETQLTRHAQEKERYYSRVAHPDNSGELATLTERVKELEAENQSVKAEAASHASKAGELEERCRKLEADNGNLEAKLKELEIREAPSTDVQTEGSDERIKELEATVETLTGEKTSLQQRKEETEGECDRLREELNRQTTLKEQLEVKVAMSDTMINDLRNQAAAARNELEQMQHEQEEVISQIQEQLDGFEELKARKDAKISELQESNASLRRTVENNLYNQANSEMKLRTEIKSLKAELAKYVPSVADEDDRPKPPQSAKPEPVKTAESQPKRRGRPKKIRIDNELADAECFAGAEVRHDDPDFGYHEPPHKPVNDNDAQLSLF
ncbi:MAG: hypothetical protein NC411_07080 [Bacteroides sp.]|nr:hypothetical protein [Bacteroides sp.]